MRIFFIFVFLILLLTPLNVVGDTTAPTIHSISMSEVSTIKNSNIVIYANLTDDISGVNYAEALLYNNERYVINVKLLYNITSSLTETVFNVGTLPSPLHIGEIIAYDNDNNRKTYSDGIHFISPILNITDAIEDLELPTLHAISIGISEVIIWC